jgi:hypothetical protein
MLLNESSFKVHSIDMTALAAALMLTSGGKVDLPKDLAFLKALHPQVERLALDQTFIMQLAQEEADERAALERFLPDSDVVRSIRKRIATLKQMARQSAPRRDETFVLRITSSRKTVQALLKPHSKAGIGLDGKFVLKSGSFGSIQTAGRPEYTRVIVIEPLLRPAW